MGTNNLCLTNYTRLDKTLPLMAKPGVVIKIRIWVRDYSSSKSELDRLSSKEEILKEKQRREEILRKEEDPKRMFSVLTSTFIFLFLIFLLLVFLFADFTLFWRVGAALGTRALSFFLLKAGFSGGFAVRALLTTEGGPSHVLFLGEEAGSSNAPNPLPAAPPTNQQPEGGEATSQPTGVVEQAGPSQRASRSPSSTESGSWRKYLNFSSENEEKAEADSGAGGGSVNQPEARPVPPANQVASPGEGADPSRPFEAYPYQPDEVIGGDSVSSIEGRLLAKYPLPSFEVIRLAHIQAEDLFEAKVDIIRRMALLDPQGDWMGRGARALDNPRTATGEESLERLLSLRDELNSQGSLDQAFAHLKGKVLRKWDDADLSSSS